tara:strand:+ start:426 stop:689 length:264 start_codon:yes stop_codon:yes gene_type:complete
MNNPIHTITEEVLCSVCSEVLVGLWIIPDKGEKKTSIKCHCCYCGDTSFVKEICGEFYLYPAEGIEITESETLDNDVVLIKLQKESK